MISIAEDVRKSHINEYEWSIMLSKLNIKWTCISPAFLFLKKY